MANPWLEKGVRKCDRGRQMAKELKTMRGARERCPTGGSCSVAGVWRTSTSRSGTPSPPGPWGCTVPPALLYPERPSTAPQPSRDALLLHSVRQMKTVRSLNFSVCPCSCPVKKCSSLQCGRRQQRQKKHDAFA